MDERDDDIIDPQDDSEMSFDPELWDIAATTHSGSWYRIDPTKIKTVEDIALLLDAINIKFIETHYDFEKIAHLLKKEDE